MGSSNWTSCVSQTRVAEIMPGIILEFFGLMSIWEYAENNFWFAKHKFVFKHVVINKYAWWQVPVWQAPPLSLTLHRLPSMWIVIPPPLQPPRYSIACVPRRNRICQGRGPWRPTLVSRTSDIRPTTELPCYLACAADLGQDIDPLEWWSRHSETLPHWSAARLYF